MLDRLIGIVRRLTGWEVAVLVLLGAGPAVAGLALVLGSVGSGDLLTVGIVAFVYYAVVALTGIVAVLVRTAKSRGFRETAAVRPVRPERAGGPSLEQGVIAQAAKIPRRNLELAAARSGSTWARDVIAYRASRGRLDYVGLMDAIAVGGSDERLVAGALDLSELLGLSRVLTAQARTERDDERIRSLVGYLGRRATGSDLAPNDLILLAERLLRAGLPDLARPLLESSAGSGIRPAMLAADLLNPLDDPAGTPEGRGGRLWLSAFNQVFQPYGLEPVRLLDGSGMAFDRLVSRADAQRKDGPLISVLMTCFRPDRSLITAVRSVAAQSWVNLEILVIDDASGPEFDAVIEEAAALDRRVRVIRARENAGTYVRRNDGLVAAHGEFVTMHDSDDWMHPRRLDLQATQLLAAPELVGTISSSVRLGEDLRFVQPRGASLRPAETSLMFRRAEALERIGYYDPIRKAADSEYRLRLEAAFGGEIHLIDSGGPLTLVRYLPQSLSGSEFREGWVHPARVAYRSSSELWHRRIREGSASPRLSHPAEARPFPAPAHLLGATEPARDLDLLVVLDGREGANPPGHLARVTREIATAMSEGLETGVLHVDGISRDTSLGIFPADLQQLVSEEGLHRVLPGDPVTAALVVVRNASVLHGLPRVRTTIDAARTVLVEDRGSGRDRIGVDVAPAHARAVAEAMFGGRAEWFVAEGTVGLGDVLAVEESPDPSRIEAVEQLEQIASPVVPPPIPSSFAAHPATIREVVQEALALEGDATILELGSGFSTMWLALTGERRGRAWRHVAIDHDERYLRETGALLETQGVAGRVDLRLAPLRTLDLSGEQYPWYDIDAIDDLIDIGLLFVDGPPSAVRIDSRFPALPVLQERLADGAVVVVDDADRDDERRMLELWPTLLPAGARLTRERTVARAGFYRFHRPKSRAHDC